MIFIFFLEIFSFSGRRPPFSSSARQPAHFGGPSRRPLVSSPSQIGNNGGLEDVIMCDICRQSEIFLRLLLAEEATKASVADFFASEFCPYLQPLYQALCAQLLVDNAGALVDAALAKVSAGDFCGDYGICEKSDKGKIVGKMIAQRSVDSAPENSCASCQEGVRWFSRNMSDPEFQQNMTASLIETCKSQFQPPASTLCAKLAVPAVPLVALLLKIEAETVDFCGTMKFCKTSSDSNSQIGQVLKQADFLRSRSKTVNSNAGLNKISSSLNSLFDEARKMKNKQMKNNQMKRSLKNDDDEVPMCQICHTTIDIIHRFSISDESKAATKQLFDDGVCENLTFIDQVSCFALSGVYVPAIFDLASQAVEVVDVCQLLEFCQTETKDFEKRENDDCTTCINAIKDGNETQIEREIGSNYVAEIRYLMRRKVKPKQICERVGKCKRDSF